MAWKNILIFFNASIFFHVSFFNTAKLKRKQELFYQRIFLQYGNIGKGDEGISYLTSSFDRIRQGYEIIENQFEHLFFEKHHLKKTKKKLVSF